jgi:hypothetical protein
VGACGDATGFRFEFDLVEERVGLVTFVFVVDFYFKI